MPDQQAGSVVEAGVSEIEVVAHADGTGIGVVAAHYRVAVSPHHGLRQGQISPKAKQPGGRRRRKHFGQSGGV